MNVLESQAVRAHRCAVGMHALLLWWHRLSSGPIVERQAGKCDIREDQGKETRVSLSLAGQPDRPVPCPLQAPSHSHLGRMPIMLNRRRVASSKGRW